MFQRVAPGRDRLRLGQRRGAADFPAKPDGFKGPQEGFIDGVVYDGRKPNEYLEKFKIGLKARDSV